MSARTLTLGVAAAAALAAGAVPALAGTQPTPLSRATGGVNGTAEVKWAEPAADGLCQHSGSATLTAPAGIADLGIVVGGQLIAEGHVLKGVARIALDRGHTPDYVAGQPWEVRPVTEVRDRATGTRTFTIGSTVYGTFAFPGAPVTGCTVG